MAIDLGIILQTVVIIGSAAGFILRMQNRMHILDVKVENLSLEIKKLSEVTISLAKQDQRLLHVEERVAIHDKYFFEERASV